MIRRSKHSWNCTRRLTVSIGVATFDSERDDNESLLAQADAALYEAKRAGRNRVAVSGQSDRMFGRLNRRR